MSMLDEFRKGGVVDREGTGESRAATPLVKRALGLAVAAAVALPLLAGCNATAMGPKQGFGTIGGAVAGGVIGSQFGKGSGKLWATGIGTLLGAWAGNEVGASLDRADVAYMQQAETMAHRARVGQRVEWSNPRSGNYGYIEPMRQGRDVYGNQCREYQQTVVIGGRAQQAYGTACRMPDGSWKVSAVSDAPLGNMFAEVHEEPGAAGPQAAAPKLA